MFLLEFSIYIENSSYFFTDLLKDKLTILEDYWRGILNFEDDLIPFGLNFKRKYLPIFLFSINYDYKIS